MDGSERKRREERYTALAGEIERLVQARRKRGGPLPALLEDRIDAKRREMAQIGRGLQGKML